MTKKFLYCDESGAKGYADQDETYPGETGVFAGIMVPEECLATVKPVFDQSAVRYTPASGKLHIADIAPAQQEALRNELFAAIKNTKLPCFWYAIHVAGLHSHHQTFTNILMQSAEALRVARDGAEPRIKRGSPREKRRPCMWNCFPASTRISSLFFRSVSGKAWTSRFGRIRWTRHS